MSYFKALKSDASTDKCVSDVRYQATQKATSQDQELIELASVIMKGWPDQTLMIPTSARPYWTFSKELTMQDGIIYKGSRIVILKALRRDLLNQLHVSHSGCAAMVQQARDAIYWSGLNADVKEVADRCDKCQHDAPGQHREILRQQSLINRG